MALRQLRSLVSGLDKDRVKNRKQKQRLNNRRALSERLEDRKMLAGPELIAIRPDSGALLREGDVLNIAPREFNLLFQGGANLREASIHASNVQLIRAGGDGLFDGVNDVAVRLGYVGLVNPGSTDPRDLQHIVFRPASSASFNTKSLSDQFPDDLYQIRLVGSGPITANSPLQNQRGEAFNSAVDFVSTFRLDRGAQVVSVVPQPVTRSGGVLTQATNVIDVYFDNQRLDLADAQNPSFYRLLNAVTPGPAATPTSVSYDPATNKATLTFTSIPEGSYRLDIGQATDDDTTVDSRGALGTADSSSSFDSSISLGPVGTATIKIAGRIEPQSIPLPPLPGGNDDPGHRTIQREAHLGSTGTDPTLPAPIRTVEYYFPLSIGTFDTSEGSGTGVYLNLITETEKQIVRDIFELYAKQGGIEFIENQGTGGLSIGKGDLRAFNPFIGPRSGVRGLGRAGEVVLNEFDFSNSNRYYGDQFTVTMYHEIGNALGLGDSFDQPSVQGDAPIPNEVLPGDVDLLHFQRITPPNSTDIDMYSFTLPTSGRLNAEVFAERLATPSLLNSALALYRRTPLPSGGFESVLVARNDQYFGADAFLGLHLAAGTYHIGVSSTGNTNYDPNVPDSGFGGTTDGGYELSLKFKADTTTELGDTRGTPLDGDADGTPGGVFSFWFQSAAPGNTYFVDKLADTISANPNQGTGTLANPFESISQGLAAAAARLGTSVSSPTIVRIIGNGGADGNLSTLSDNRPYLVGTTLSNTALPDGAEFRVPAGVNVVIDAGTLIKLRKANIEAGSSSAGVNRAGGSIQVFGTPTDSVFLRSYHDDAVGGNSDGVGPGMSSGDFGGIVFRDDSDREANGIFLNYVNHADIKHGGGKVFVDSAELPFTSIHVANARPTISYNLISLGNTAAISASPDSFDDSLGRIGPDVHGNYLVNNSIDGLFVRIDTPLGSNTTKLRVSGRFNDTDITHVLSENLIIAGGSGGPVRDAMGVLHARPAGRLQIDPGIVLKLNKARIEAERGAAALIAEGTVDRPIVFTSQTDKRYGGSGAFDTNRSPTTSPAAGDWSGLFFSEATSGSIDQAIITFGGGVSSTEGSAFPFNAVEIHQADVRIANSLIEANAATVASSTNNRNGRGSNGLASIYVRGAEPIIVNNTITDNVGSAISINANSLKADILRDRGRSTGLAGAYSVLDDNYGPLIRFNRLDNNGTPGVVGGGVNGMVVRGEEVTVESVWDDTDIVHVVQSEITVDNLHSLGGLTLQSSNSESLVIKFAGATAGFTATGTPVEIEDRIGGTIHVLGQPGFPVVMTSLNDCSVGAGFTPDGLPQNDTTESGGCGIIDSSAKIVDIVILLDDTGSFATSGATLATVFPQIVTQLGLALAGTDFAFSIARFEDYSDTTSAQDRPFILNQPIISTQTPNFDVAINAALNRASPGFGGSFPESAIEGLWQVATGNGFDGNGDGDSVDSGVAGLVATQVTPGAGGDVPAFSTFTPDPTGPVLPPSGTLGGVGWRANTDQKIVILATDASFTYEGDGLTQYTGVGGVTVPAIEFTSGGAVLTTPGGRGAQIQTTVDRLVSDGIKVIGLGTGPLSQRPLEALATLTGATDAAGNPLFFTIQPDNAALISTGVVNAITGSVNIANPAAAGDWRGLVFDEFSNDRNVAVVRELENPLTNKQSVNSAPSSAQYLGVLAPNFVTATNPALDQKAGDENRRLGFEVHGFISPDDGNDVDVYSFTGTSGTPVWIDIDRTDSNLDAVVEVIDATTGAALAASAGPITSAATLTQNSRLGGDFYSQNFRDPGFYYVLPGTVGTEGTYFVRVSSNSTIPAGNAQSRGKYQLQIRTQQIDEFPGSTVRYADIRFATTGIDVRGLPAHSPLIGEAGELPTLNNTFDSAQTLVNLLQTDAAAIGISGALADDTDVDWYEFELTQTGVEQIRNGIDDNGGTVAVVFDIDYADGAVSADTTIAVYDQNRRLVYIGRESNVEDDQRPNGVTGINDLSRGSLAKKDGYIGPIHLTPGLDLLTSPTKRYFVAVMSNRQLPTALTGVFSAAVNDATAQVRLEPVNSVRRIVEDHIGFQGYASGGAQASLRSPLIRGTTVTPTASGGLFDISNTVALSANVKPFTLQNVALYVATDVVGTAGTTGANDSLYTVDPFASRNALTRVTNSIVTGGFNDVQDIVIRSDGRMFGYQRLSGNTGTVGALVQIDPEMGTASFVGNDNILGQSPTPNTSSFATAFQNNTTRAFRANQFTTSDEVDAFTFQRTGTSGAATAPVPTYDVFYAVRESDRSSKLYRADANGNATATLNSSNNPFYGFVGDIQPAGVTYATRTLKIDGPAATAPAVTPFSNIRLESKVAGTAGNFSVVFAARPNNTNVSVSATGSVITLTIGGTGGPPITGAPSVADIVDAINNHVDASKLVTAVIFDGNANASNDGGGGHIAVSVSETSSTSGANGPSGPLAGRVTGLSFGNFSSTGNLYGVTSAGEFIQINTATGTATVLNTVPGQSFQGLALGPQNVEAGNYANTLFAVTSGGNLYAFNANNGALRPVFSGGATFINVGGMTGNSAVPIGLAFSPLDFNLWHPTTRRGNDVGHGVNVVGDGTRNPADEPITISSPGDTGRTSNQINGGASLQFGFEPWLNDNLKNQNTQSYLTFGSQNAQYGILNELIHADLSSNSAISGTYNFPAGALGAMETKTFSLSGTAASDRPTLYFNYFLDTENAPGTLENAANDFRDSARVWAKRQGSSTWELLATNNSQLSGANPSTGGKAELPGFLSHLSDAGLNTGNQRPESVQLRQELFDNSGQWRQARVDLSSFAGESNLQLRFDFSTAGAFNDPSLGSIDSNFGEFSSTTRSIRSLNNGFEGFYIDDIIIGYAERGEMVTGASADAGITDLNLDDRTRDQNPNRNLNILNGPYQLEVRRSSDYGSYNDNSGATRITTTYNTNDRHITDLTGTGLLADRNREREQGAFIIESNFITDFSLRGINVQPGAPQGTGGGVPHPGSLINFPQTNADRLVPGVVIQNNVIVGGSTGIRFAGETVQAPQRPVPFGRIINNTLVGLDGSGTGVQIVGFASPTLLNNLLTDLGTGIVNNGTGTVIRSNFFQNNVANGATGTSATVVTLATTPLFVDAANRNYYLVADSAALDSSQNVEQDRADYSTFKQELGVPNSPILAPDRDVFGQLRIDSSGSTTGGGSSVFKDRGAVDRSDKDSPYAVLINPIDNDSVDRDPNETVVHLTDPLLENFKILLGDGRGAGAPFEGTGVNGLTVSDPADTLVAARAVTIVHNGRTLVQGLDYTFGYNSLTGVLLLTPLATLWDPTGVYTITLDNTQIEDLAGLNLRPNQSDGTTRFFILMPDVRLDFGDAPDSFKTLLASNAARHTIQPGAAPRLGFRIDSEDGGGTTPLEDDLRQVVVASSPSALFATTATATGYQVVVTGAVPVGGEQVTVQIGPNTATFELVAPGFAPQQGNIAIDLVSTNPGDIANDLAAAIRSRLVFEGDAAVVTALNNVITIESFDDEDGVGVGLYTAATVGAPPHSPIVFLKGGRSTPTATADDVLGFLNPSDLFGTKISITATHSDPLATTAGLLDAWIDFNDDGAFDPNTEQIFTNQILAVGPNKLTIVTPAGTSSGTRWARFRISERGNLGPNELAIGGEVEDYLVEIIDVAPATPAHDPFTINEDQVLDTVADLTRASLFDNDTLTGFLPSRFIVETQPTNGVLVVADPVDGTLSGRFVYTPAADFYGQDSFTYWISTQPEPGTTRPANVALATVTITVAPVNDAPLAVDKQFVALEDTAVTITADQLLVGAVGHASPQYVSPTGETYPWDETNQDPSNIEVVAINIGGINYTTSSGPITTSRGSFVLNFAAGVLVNLVFDPADDLNRDNVRGPLDPAILQSFLFTIRDNGVSRDPVTDAPIAGIPLEHTATATINVAPSNDDPTTAPDRVTVGVIGDTAENTAWRQFFGAAAVPVPTEDVTLVIPSAFLLQNDLAGTATALDENNFVGGNDAPLRITSVSINNRDASVSIDASGDVVFVPPRNVYGDVVFTYIVTDSGVDEALDGARTINRRTATGTVTVTLQPVNDDPVTYNRAFNYTESAAAGVDSPAHVFTAAQLLGGTTPSVPGIFAADLPAPFNEAVQSATLRVVAFSTAAGIVDSATLSGGSGTLSLNSNDGGRFDFTFANFAFTTGQFVPRADYNSRTPFAPTETFQYIIEDDGQTVDPADSANSINIGRKRSAPATATIVINQTNDAPIFNIALNSDAKPIFDIFERDDLGGTVLSSAVVSILPGPTTAVDELLRQQVSFEVLFGPGLSSEPAGLMAANPAISDSGTLTIFPAVDAVGTAVYVFDAVDREIDPATGQNVVGFVERRTRGTLTVNVRPVNDAPRIKPMVPVDTRAAGPDEFWAVNQATGTITYTLKEDNTGANGVTSPYAFGASTTAGRIGLLEPYIVGPVVAPGNESDSTPGGSQTLRITSFPLGTNSITTALGGTVRVVLPRNADNSPTQFEYIPPADYNSNQGSVDFFDYTFEDNAPLGEQGVLGSSNLLEGSLSRSGRVQFLLNPVNDAPTAFSIPTKTYTALEDDGAVTVPGFAINIAPGPSTAGDELTNQTPSFDLAPVVTPGQITEDDLFLVKPSIGADGALTFTSKLDAVGSISYVVNLLDDGADNSARGDINRVGSETITIHVRPVNDQPRLVSPALLDTRAAGPDEAWTVSSTGVITYTLREDNSGPGGATTPYEFYALESQAPTGSAADGRIGLLDVFTVGPRNEADATLGGSQTLRVVSVQSTTAMGGTVTMIVDNGTTRFQYIPPANYNSLQGVADTFTYLIEDDAPNLGEDWSRSQNALVEQRRTRTGRVQFVLNPVNDRPVFLVSNASHSAREDSGPVVVSSFATGIAVGPASATDEPALQSAAFTVSPLTPENGLFTVSPSIDANGTLRYTPTANAVGSIAYVVTLVDTGSDDSSGPSGAARGDLRSSNPATITIHVRPVNDTPGLNPALVIAPTDPTTVNNAGEITYRLSEDNTQSPGNDVPYVIELRGSSLTGRVGLFDPFTVGPANEADSTTGGSQVLRVTNIPAATELGGTLTPVLDPDGSGVVTHVLYTPPANYNSLQGPPDSFQYTFEDSNGGGETFDLATSTLIADPLSRTSRVFFVLTSLNDAPQFDGAADVTVNEDSTSTPTTGLTVVPNFVTNIAAGPSGADDELLGMSPQTVTFSVVALSGNAPGLFAVAPRVDAAGTLTFTTSPDANGVGRFTIVAIDTGTGQAVDPLQSNTSIPEEFTITVTAVNDAPSFTAGANVAVNEDSGPYSVTTPYATSIVAGPANEIADGQTVSFTVTTPTASQSLFSVQPSVSPAGFLTFTPADDAVGTVVVNVVAVDNLGATSLPSLLTITVREVNDPPTANNFSVAIDEDNTVVVRNSEFLVLATDPDLQSNPNEALTISGLMAVSALGAAVTVNSTGDVVYDPRASATLQALRPGQQLVDTFTYRLVDAAGATSDPATVTITVSGRNDAPVAVNDSAVLLSGQSSILRPLLNDSDVDGTLDPATLIITNQPVNGSLSVQADGSLIYTPRSGFRGQDSIAYTIADNLGQQSAQAIISLDVAPLPTIADIATGAFVGESVTIDLSGADVPVGTLDFTSVVIVRDPVSGTVTILLDGSILYTPDADFVGTDSFDFTISDMQGRTSDPVTVTVHTVSSRLQNPVKFTDVNADGNTNALDALLILNHLSRSIRRGDGNTIPVLDTDRGPNFYDVNGNGSITSVDALRVINQIARDNRRRLSGGEGESPDAAIGLLAAPEMEGSSIIVISTSTAIEPISTNRVSAINHSEIAADTLLRGNDEIDLLAWDVREDDDSDEGDKLEAFDAAWSDFSHL